MKKLINAITQKLIEVLNREGFNAESHSAFVEALQAHVQLEGSVKRIEIGDHVSEEGWVSHGRNEEYNDLHDSCYDILQLLETWVGAYEDSWYHQGVVITIHELDRKPAVTVSILYYSDIVEYHKRKLSFVFLTDLTRNRIYPADDTTPFVHTNHRFPSLRDFLTSEDERYLTLTIE